MLGCLDYVNWKWKNCPTAWAGQYSRCQGKPTIILEAVTSYDLWMWPAYFGLPGSNNDINAIQSSILFDKLARVITPANYNILGKVYDDDYYLAGGTYPKWSTLVQTISWPQGLKKQYFAAMQEGIKKMWKRTFGVLQAHFAIMKGLAYFWDECYMTACVILHNMTVEDEREEESCDIASTQPSNAEEMEDDDDKRFRRFLARHKIQDREAHFEFRNALIEHLW